MLNAKAEKNQTLTPYLVSNSKLEQYALNIIRNLQFVTSDDFHVIEKEIENCDRDRRVIGALLKSLERQGYLTPVGYVKSQRKECHGRPVVRWRVNNFG